MRYGDADVIVDAFIRKTLNWPVIKSDNPKALDDFAIFLAECERAVQDLEAIKVLEYSENFKKIVSKLPYSLHDKWRSAVQKQRENGHRPTFHYLVQFVRKEAQKVNDPVFGKIALTGNQKTPGKHINDQTRQKSRQKYGSFAAKVTAKNTSSGHNTVRDCNPCDQAKKTQGKSDALTSPCIYCKGDHALESCRELSTLPFYNRIDILQSKGCCFGCLRYGHYRRFCRNKATCVQCNGCHPSILHVDGSIPPRLKEDTKISPHSDVVEKPTSARDQEPNQSVISACTNTSCDEDSSNETHSNECTMAIIPVKVRLSGSTRVLKTYAFLDPGSNVSFCSENLRRSLGAQGRRLKLNMETMGMAQTIYTYELHGLALMDLQENNCIYLPAVYSKQNIPVSNSHIPTMKDLQRWPHLKDIYLPEITSDIGLLIGNNIPDVCAPLKVRVGPRGTPYATKSVLGWIPWNVFRESSGSFSAVNRADVIAIEQVHDLREINDHYIKSVNYDFPEKTIDDQKEHSIEDKLFLKRLSESQKFKDGHYEFCLPFRHTTPSLPDNKILAVQRLKGLKKKLILNDQFFDDYKQFMKTLLEKGFSEKVPEDELNRDDGKTWYLPHHGVYHPNKPRKIRVVFDCSARYHEVSLNDQLLTGPDLTNNLVAVLIKFRQEPIAVMGDIEKMFYQVKVAKDDRDCLRYLWWPDGNLNADPTIYRMTVHIFGASSSPSCSNFALHQTFQDNECETFIRQAASSNFYVDDFLCSTATEIEAIQLVKGITSLCQKGGFHVTKWMSNRRSVLATIPEHDRATSIANLDFEHFPKERVLGVSWNIETDNIVFDITDKSYGFTRRNILSVIGSVYDPLGIVSPLVLPARLILQDLCRKEIGWDEDLSENDIHKWKQWLSDLPKYKSISVPRCIKPDHFHDISRIELHRFADACESGYGTVSYIRFISTGDQIHCELLFAKSKVAPLKKITVTRMELASATIAVKINKMMSKELQFPSSEIFFWTDSMTVIRYIRNISTRYKTFVANRLAIIHEGSDVSQWHFVDGSCDLADLASRGFRPDETNKLNQWLHGPEFLWNPRSEWPSDREMSEDNMNISDDTEVKKCTNTVLIKTSTLLDEMISQYSSFMKLRRVVGWILMFIKSTQAMVHKRKLGEIPLPRTRSETTKAHHSQHRYQRDNTIQSKLHDIFLPVEILQAVDYLLIRHVQQQSFPKELEALSEQSNNGDKLKKSSPLYKLDPFLKEGIIRVGGRLRSSNLHYDAQHQIVLPADSLLTMLILREIHKSVGHQGKNAMLAELHQMYWIPRASSLIKRITSKCVLCRRYQARCEEQKMADLPQDRVISGKQPFTSVGMDYFGPIEVKRGRTTLKRYGVIFTCSSSRAVHLEVACSLDTDSCINAIRRFIARRGPVKIIRSDNGTNLGRG